MYKIIQIITNINIQFLSKFIPYLLGKLDFVAKSILVKHMHYFKMQKLYLQVLFAQYVLSSGLVALLFSQRI